MFHTVKIEDLSPANHPLRRIRKMVNTGRIRELCAPLYCANNGRRRGWLFQQTVNMCVRVARANSATRHWKR